MQRALEYLRGLTQEAGGDASLSRELAEAYLKVGDLQGNPYVSSLGDTAGAIASYQQAVAIADAVLRRDPADVQSRIYAAKAHCSLGEVLPLRGDPSGAVTHLRQAISVLEAGGGSGDTELRHETARVYEMLGDILGHSGLTNLGDAKGARAAYEKSLAILEALAKEHPADAQYRNGEAILQTKAGDMLADASEWEAAIVAYRAAAALFEGLRAANPHDADALRGVALTDQKLGLAYASHKQKREALIEFGKGADVARQMMAADPKDARARMSYAIALKYQADLLSDTGDDRGALPLYRDAMGLLQGLYESEPGNLMVKSRYSMISLYVAGILYKQHQRGESRGLYVRGLALAKEVADRPGATPDEIRSYADALVECEFTDLDNGVTGITYARRAAEMTNYSTPRFVQSLAMAYADAGDLVNAVATEEKLVAMTPPSPERDHHESILAGYRQELKEKNKKK